MQRPFTPPHIARIRGVARTAATGATCPARRTARGPVAKSPRAARGFASKGRQAGESRTPSHQPHWGFLLFVTTACAGREGEGDDVAPRRGKEDANQLGTRNRERGAGAEEDDPRRGHLPRLHTPLHRAGHDYTAAPP
jgi:hypothetical protein